MKPSTVIVCLSFSAISSQFGAYVLFDVYTFMAIMYSWWINHTVCIVNIFLANEALFNININISKFLLLMT